MFDSLRRELVEGGMGDPAPKFCLPLGDGSSVTLDDFLGKKNLVSYFYPKDNSAGFTREACSFRDSYSVFKELEAEIVGISPDSSRSHAKFARGKRLPFPLLSDSDGYMRRIYGVRSTFGVIAGRTTFVIDKHGLIGHVYSSQYIRSGM
jgi:peroxiredoxin Q/BCP